MIAAFFKTLLNFAKGMELVFVTFVKVGESRRSALRRPCTVLVQGRQAKIARPVKERLRVWYLMRN
jgi:hypothetical protein